MDSVIVFDCNTLQVLKKIKVGQNPDAIIYDPVSKRVFTFNGKSNDATAIDVLNDEVAGTIALTGKPEYAVPDGTGRMFVNIEDKGTIIKFDAKTLKVEAEWPLDPGKEPTGLALTRKQTGCSRLQRIKPDDRDGCNQREGCCKMPDRRRLRRADLHSGNKRDHHIKRGGNNNGHPSERC